MNLHILTDSNISDTFHRNLRNLGLLDNNFIVVRSNAHKLKHIKDDVPFARLYSSAFHKIVGDTGQYDKVFLHQFSPLMYRWVARQNFKELNWMIWGADLYNLPGIGFNFYESITRKKYVASAFHWNRFLFKLKILITNSIFRTRAYSKVNHIMTWMKSEYDFAKQHLPSLTATQRFFFYENSVPYHELDNLIKSKDGQSKRDKPRLIVGNSGTPTNNHLDTIARLEENHIKADLIVPVSYGDEEYIRFIKNNLPIYTGGKIELSERFMAFDEYINFCMDCDGLIMNNIRPQGYGNILTMAYLGKPVFLNEKNISLPDLDKYGITIAPWSELVTNTRSTITNKQAIANILSHEKLEVVYRELFSRTSGEL